MTPLTELLVQLVLVAILLWLLIEGWLRFHLRLRFIPQFFVNSFFYDIHFVELIRDLFLFGSSALISAYFFWLQDKTNPGLLQFIANNLVWWVLVGILSNLWLYWLRSHPR